MKIDTKFSRCSALHFDLTKNNIFYNENWNYKIGFIDFDDAIYGPSIYDVAIASSLLFFSKKRGVDEDDLRVFIDSYYYDNKDEIKYLKQCALAWLEYLMKNNNFDISITESFKAKKTLIEKFFDDCIKR